MLPLASTYRSSHKSLILGATASHVEGMDLREGQLLLAKLRGWATREQFVDSHEWTVDDMVMWDNTGTMHRVLAYPGQRPVYAPHHGSGRRAVRLILDGSGQA